MTDQSFDAMRRAMVACQLRTTAVNDPLVVEMMGTVPREAHVPADRTALAYVDIALPLADGRALVPPMVTGRLLTEARVERDDRVLLVGAATGYTAALLARMARSVTALEEAPALIALARAAGVADNVTLVEGPLVAGWAEGAPYDLILIDGAVERVPQPLIDQLADGGRLATGLVERGVARLAIGRRAGTGFGLACFADAETPVLPGFAVPQHFSF